jgi:type I restriction enzyme S subunit
MSSIETLTRVGIKDPTFDFMTISQLVKKGIIEKPLDGNHGEIHPKSEDFVDSGIPFIMASDIDNGIIDYSNCNFITRKQADSLRKGFAINGDVLLTHKATIGRTAIVKYDAQPYVMLTPQVTYYRVLDSEKLNRHYLRYFFESSFFQETLSLWAGSGSTRAYLGITEQGKLPFVLPPINKQNKIAATLKAYDDLIENNQQRIALLEKIAEELYREWFVRLRFPGYEKVKVIKGVPEGWSIDKVESIGKVITGKTPSTENTRYFGGEFHFIKTPDMHNNMFIFDTDETLTKDGIDSQKSQTIPPNSICVSCIGTGGIVSITTRTCQTNQQINTIVLQEKNQLEWAFFTIRNLKETIQMFGSTGTTMTNLSKGKFSSLKLIKPEHGIINRFHSQVQPMFEQIANLMQQTKAFKKSRDILLPRLISGKLSVEHLDIQFPPSMQDDATTPETHQTGS